MPLELFPFQRGVTIVASDVDLGALVKYVLSLVLLAALVTCNALLGTEFPMEGCVLQQVRLLALRTLLN